MSGRYGASDPKQFHLISLSPLFAMPTLEIGIPFSYPSQCSTFSRTTELGINYRVSNKSPEGQSISDVEIWTASNSERLLVGRYSLIKIERSQKVLGTLVLCCY